MPSSPTVSVVIPSYQHAAYVGRAVESVLAQTLRDIEVIVVDDGSTDGTPDIVERIRDPRLRLVRLPENRRDHARNLGVSLATGRYIAFQNSDDEWAPTKLERQIGCMEAHPDIGACFTQVRIIDAAGQASTGCWADGLFFDGRSERTADEWLRTLFFGNCLCIVSSVVRAELLPRAGAFRPSLVQLSDLDLWVRVASTARLHVLPEPLTHMRVDGMRNLSAPRADVHMRALFEQVEVLAHYTRAPLLGRLADIFPALADARTLDPVLQQALLARLAAQHGAPAHRMFADRTMARLIDTPADRQRLVDAYGAQAIHFFTDNRARIGQFSSAPPALTPA